MEIISFEKRTFEEIAAKLDYFVQRVESLCSEHGGKETGEWMDNHEVCRRLRISPRTLDRKSTRLNSSHIEESRMPSSA